MTSQERINSANGLRKSRIITIGSVAILGVLGMVMLGGCPSGNSSDPPGPNQVFMRAIAFDPAEITITVGESVTWTNQDFIIPHTATSGNPGDADLGSVFKSALLTTNGTFTHTFDTVGEFVYFCEVHPVMMRDAKVIVIPTE